MKANKTIAILGTVAALLPLMSGPGAGSAAAQVGQPVPPPAGTPTSERMFDDPNYERTWRRTDYFVITGELKRSFFWGPGVLTENLMEEYAEGAGGTRSVQYFDKSRMEINNANADRKSQFFVTNGLLTYELITGNMQVGNNSFRFRWPAEIPVASDPDDIAAVTYSSFRGAVARTDDARFKDQVITAQVFKSGSLDFDHGGAGYAELQKFGVKNVYFEPATGHNIPNVFWDFLNQRGLVWEEGSPGSDPRKTALLNDPWFYATGYPVSDAYWTSAKIEGKPGTRVLVQPFQRRVLTYVPSFPEGWKVQMGNIGQHYYDWRYKNAGKPASIAGTCREGYPKLGFSYVYNLTDQTKVNLGCALGSETQATVRRQAFEGGEILGVTNYIFSSGRYAEDVFVLYSDHSVRTFPSISLAEERAPRGDFGALLAANADVQGRLRQPTGPMLTNVYNPDAKTGGAPIQHFDNGIMVYSPRLEERKVYVLHNQGGYAYIHNGPHVRLIQVDRWSLHDDRSQ